MCAPAGSREAKIPCERTLRDLIERGQTWGELADVDAGGGRDHPSLDRRREQPGPRATQRLAKSHAEHLITIVRRTLTKESR